MVDTPKKDDNKGRKDPVENNSPVAPPKHRRQRCRSKPHREKDGNTSTGDNNTPENTEDHEAPVEPQSEQDEWEEGQVDPENPIGNEGLEDGSYIPISEEDESLGDEEFIVPEEPFEQERFKRRLIATTRSLKKKQRQLQADQDLLNDRWTDVLAAKEYGLKRPTKNYPKRKLLPQFNDKAPEPISPKHNAVDGPDRPLRGLDRAATQAEHPPAPPRHKGRETTATGYTYDLWQDLDNRAGQTIYQYKDQGGGPQREKMAIKPGATNTTSPGPKIAYGHHLNRIMTWPDTEAPHTPYASPTRQ